MLGNGCFSISSEPTNLFKKDYGLPRPLIATWLKLENKTSHQQFCLFNSRTYHMRMSLSVQTVILVLQHPQNAQLIRFSKLEAL